MDRTRNVIELELSKGTRVKIRLTTWRALRVLANIMDCHLTPGTRVQNAFDDVASTIHQSLPGVAPASLRTGVGAATAKGVVVGSSTGVVVREGVEAWTP
jgi:hypothetical protein